MNDDYIVRLVSIDRGNETVTLAFSRVGKKDEKDVLHTLEYGQHVRIWQAHPIYTVYTDESL